MEDHRGSKLLIYGQSKQVLNLLKVLESSWEQPSDAFSKEIKDLELFKGFDQDFKTKLHLENKYYRAEIMVTATTNLNEDQLDRYDACIFIHDNNPKADEVYRRYMQKCENLEFTYRITIVNHQCAEFDIEQFLEDKPVYIETIWDDMEELKPFQQGGYKMIDGQNAEEINDVRRLIEGFNECLWQGYTEKQKEIKEPEALPKPIESPEQQTTEPDQTKANGTEDGSKAGKKGTGLDEPSDDEEIEKDMKIFDDIMNFKMRMTDMPNEERKKIAEKLMNQLVNNFGDI